MYKAIPCFNYFLMLFLSHFIHLKMKKKNSKIYSILASSLKFSFQDLCKVQRTDLPHTDCTCTLSGDTP